MKAVKGGKHLYPGSEVEVEIEIDNDSVNDDWLNRWESDGGYIEDCASNSKVKNKF